MTEGFEPGNFLPYLLNQAAEEVGTGFQVHYRRRYGMLRTEWRVLFHLGRYGEMTATDICRLARTHKTKVSRAIAALEKRRFVARRQAEGDRRLEPVALTRLGHAAFEDLAVIARRYNEELLSRFPEGERATLLKCLVALAGMPAGHTPRPEAVSRRGAAR